MTFFSNSTNPLDELNAVEVKLVGNSRFMDKSATFMKL